jgi:hypothetical protein
MTHFNTQTGSHHGISYTLTGPYHDATLKDFYYKLLLELPDDPNSLVSIRQCPMFEIKSTSISPRDFGNAAETVKAFCSIAARAYGVTAPVEKYARKKA